MTTMIVAIWLIKPRFELNKATILEWEHYLVRENNANCAAHRKLSDLIVFSVHTLQP